jgi:hypothetical protein
MEFITGLVIGLIIGWVVLKRPQWATDIINWVKTKIGMVTSP